ncbi:MAG: 30S ribosomal protein S6 [Alphaproteobacteria bacterium]|nr:30S ribosomal protein S6 [Alphaproteobacteria bacterium]
MRYTEYETIYIVKPEASEDILKAIQEKFNSIIERFEGHILNVDDWGKRKLAYPIKKNSKGHYVYVHYLAPTETIVELERNLRIDSNLMRFLSVKLDTDVDVETALSAAAEHRTTKARPSDDDDESEDSSSGSQSDSEASS